VVDQAAGWIERQGCVVPAARIVFVPTPKSACTTILWALAGPDDAPATRARRSVSRQQTRDLTIHDPLVHGLRSLRSLPAPERAAILADPEWVRFCVVRDPYQRLISGWVDRVLLGRSADRLGPVGDDAGAMFREFVADLLDVHADLLDDVHFAPQARVLAPDTFPYTDVVESAGLADFFRTLQASDPARAGLQLARRNDGIGFDAGRMYDAATAAVVEQIFVDDFTTFGFPHREFPPSTTPVPLTANEVVLIDTIRRRDERIADLSALATELAEARSGADQASGDRAVSRWRSRRGR